MESGRVFFYAVDIADFGGWTHILNSCTPSARIFIDAKEADKVFDILMDDEVAPRKRFIQTHAKNVVNLDI